MNFKKTISTAAVLLIMLTEIPYALAATFSDVQSTNTYYTAIESLATAGFIVGYSDGTFQPNRIVNRAEFLKLAMSVSGTSLDSEWTSHFSDVDENAWYANYVKKALSEKWIEGYTDGTFRPEQGITKAEGIKIIAKVQGWKTGTVNTPPFDDTPISAWYTTYIAYAKEHKFLEETGTNYIPDAILSRGKVSGILYRTYISGEIPTQTNNTPSTQETTNTTTGTPKPVIPATPALNFTPVTPATNSTTIYSNIKLNESFPNTFYLNEVYYFEGTILSGDYDSISMILAPKNETDSAEFTYYTVTPDNNTFKIPVIFDIAGNYNLGILLGNSGTSKIVDISVLPSLPKIPSITNKTAPNNQSVSFKDQKTNISWDDNGNGLIRLTIFQGTKTKIFLFRQGSENFDIDYTSFSNFKAGEVWYLIEGAKAQSTNTLQITTGFAASATKSFQAIKHDYCRNLTDQITITNYPEKYSSVQTIKFSGTTKTDIREEAMITKPNGLVESVNLTTTSQTEDYYGSTIIKSGKTFGFEYKATQKGTYIVEINTKLGEATLNCPVYITTSIPLIPDYFDLNKDIDTEPKSSISTLRTTMLELINAERKAVGLSSVTLDTELNNLAQLHSEDMVTRNFFDHINPDGQSPEDRRKELNIKTPVRENLSEAPTLLYGHNGLMRSGAHRANVLNSEWTKVGIGIAWDTNGQIYITQEFSYNPLTTSDLLAIKEQIFEGINDIRETTNKPLLSSDTTLSGIADTWSQKMVTEDFFDFTSTGETTLESLIQSAIPNQSVQAIIAMASSSAELVTKILESDNTINDQLSIIGIGLKNDDIGILKTTLLYSTP
jgi:uncharacterized protein YkwD